MVSVVVPVLNEEKLIGGLIDSLRQQSMKPDEIIVVDGGSKDSTAEIVRKKKVRFLATSRGVGHQRNHGGKSAVSDIMIFMDADVFPEKNFLRDSLEEFKERKLDIACPHFLPHPRNLLGSTVFSMCNFFFFLTQKFSPSGAGPCIIVNKSLFDKTCFDESLNLDDMEFIRRAGHKGNYGFLNSRLKISSRRFKKEGFVLLLKYLLLSFLFAFGLFRLTNKIDYKFSHYGR